MNSRRWLLAAAEGGKFEFAPERQPDHAGFARDDGAAKGRQCPRLVEVGTDQCRIVRDRLLHHGGDERRGFIAAAADQHRNIVRQCRRVRRPGLLRDGLAINHRAQ